MTEQNQEYKKETELKKPGFENKTYSALHESILQIKVILLESDMTWQYSALHENILLHIKVIFTWMWHDNVKLGSTWSISCTKHVVYWNIAKDSLLCQWLCSLILLWKEEIKLFALPVTK